MRILKFGGTSVANAERFRQILSLIRHRHEHGEKLCLVSSATSGSTNELLSMGAQAQKGNEAYKEGLQKFYQKHIDIIDDLFEGALKAQMQIELEDRVTDLRDLLTGVHLLLEASPRTTDYLVSFGERVSTYLLSNFLQSEGLPTQFLDARKIIFTDKTFGAAKVDKILTYRKIREYFDAVPSDSIQVVTGFISSAKGGLTSTLGRGGSDFTASLLGAALDAEAIEIWTDVDGVLTADPRKVKQALSIPIMTYVEAMEMSHFGAKVIYPPTILPAMDKGVPIYIKNTFKPNAAGTHISAQSSPDKRAVKGVSSIHDISLITLSGSGLFGVPGIAAKLFQSLSDAEINVILITQGSSEYSISFAIDPIKCQKAIDVVEDAFAFEKSQGLVEDLKVETDLSVVAIIGENMRYAPGIAGRMLTALGNNGVNAIAIAQGSSELNISVVVNQENEAKAIQALHEDFFLSESKTIHVFLVGVGLIGSTLIKQFQNQTQFLKEERGIEIRIKGITNSKKMLFDVEGIPLDQWSEKLQAEGEASDMQVFVDRMIEMNLPNAVFVDCTASSLIPPYYQQVLDASISVSTPNKIAGSSDYDNFNMLRLTAKRKNVLFGFETNVGAGLPVISTLKNLVDSGDEILRIDAVLSGSLSYIFNHYTPEISFEEIVSKAKELGYTEPDPREDLSGMDVCRKIMILARVAGFKLERADVEIQDLLPTSFFDAASVSDFFHLLRSESLDIAAALVSAKKEGKKLRYIASFENGKAKVGMQVVGPDNPFYKLDGSDNMIVYTTKRYHQRPLVIQGPGAGAEVTAAGVFSEIIQTARKF